VEKHEGPEESRYSGRDSKEESSKYKSQICLVREFTGSHT
jgi:hypothetical protein